MVYVLGWMFSDGTVHSDKRTFEIKISARDLKILKRIRAALKSSHPLSIFVQKLPSREGFAKYASLRISSYPMCKDLIALGCVPKKTRKILIPNMPRNLLKHFVRGYFDGDGSISFNKPNTIRIRIVSASEQFITNLTKVFMDELGIGANYRKSNQAELWQCEYYGDNARNICRWMYENCGDLYLERKRTRFIKHMERRQNHA